MERELSPLLDGLTHGLWKHMTEVSNDQVKLKWLLQVGEKV